VPTEEELANNNELFLTLASKSHKWEEPAEPIKIVDPLYFVGTKGLGAFLFTTPEGHILMNTGMPSSGPMITESIRKLGFIRIMINGHAHVDHAGAFAYLKELWGARLAIMKEDVQAIEEGGKEAQGISKAKPFEWGRDAIPGSMMQRKFGRPAALPQQAW
jgi:metallo-beta-lactamase class B